MEYTIEVDDVVKAYPLGQGRFTAVDHLSLTVAAGEFVAVVGRSGSGKWPDFCFDPDQPYDCKAQAAKLSPGIA